MSSAVESWVQVLDVDKKHVRRPPGAEYLVYTGQVAVTGDRVIARCLITTGDGDPLPSSQVGDIWIDRVRSRVFYLSGTRVWTEWFGHLNGIQPVGHPLFQRYLLAWHPGRKAISWLASSLVSKLKKSYPGTFSTAIEHLLSGRELPSQSSHQPRLLSPVPTTVLDNPSDATDDFVLPSANLTYSQSWRRDSCIEAQRGIEFPESSPTITWWNGLQTVLPFAGAVNGVPIAEDEDIETVRCMATEGRDATACPPGENEPPLLVLDLPNKMDKESRALFFDQCRVSISRGRPVLVRNWHGDASAPDVDWSREDMEFEFSDLRRDVIWQGLRARDRARLRQTIGSSNATQSPWDDYWVSKQRTGSKVASAKKQTAPQLLGSDVPSGSIIHAHGHLGDFLDLINTPDACVNLLDLGSEDRNRPWFINSLCDHSKSIVQTEKRNYAHVAQGRSKNPIALADAPAGFSRDFYALNEWKLLTSAGYLTFPHHDAGGLCTYISMRSGLKIWGIFIPKASSRNSQPLIAATNAILELDNWQKHADLYLVMLTPGSVLIQPPGLLHLVYSPVKSIALGGHFFTFEALHLTAWSRRVEHSIGEFSTNQEHPSVERYLARMMLALENKQDQKRYEKPLLALALMLLDIDAFAHQSSSELERDEEWIGEIEAAKKFALQIAIHTLALGPRASVARISQLLRTAIQQDNWFDPGSKLVELPDLQHEKLDWPGTIAF